MKKNIRSKGLLTQVMIAILVVTPVSVIAANAEIETYPNKPVHLVVPFPPGGGVDILSRILGKQLSEEMGQPVIIENRSGGNTLVAAQHVMKAKPDGYTLFATIDSTMVMNSALYQRLPYDPQKDFTPITIATNQPMVIAVQGGSPLTHIGQLYEIMKTDKEPVQYSFGATPAQVVAEIFQEQAGVKLDAIAYEGSAAAVQDVIAGHIPVTIDALSPSFNSINSGQLRALAVTTKDRSKLLPDVPSIAETIAPDFDVASWTGVFAPAGMEANLQEKIYQYMKTALNSEAVQKSLSELGLNVIALDPTESTEIIESEIKLYGDIIEKAQLRIN